MPEPDARFRTYLKAFFNDWLTSMSGPLSVPFAAAAVWSSGHIQRVLWGSLAVVAAVFGSYRVWSKERRDADTQLAAKESELAQLRDRVAELSSKRKPDLEMKVSAEGAPPLQVLKIVANRPVTVSRVDYMLSSAASIAGEDMSVQGETVEVPINDSLVLKLWNTPRHDRNNFDHSGPAKVGLTVSADGQSHQYILPVQMESTWQGNTASRKLVGSQIFYGEYP